MSGFIANHNLPNGLFMFDVVVLAAGKGSRMKSITPKVLHPIAGKPMLKWATEAAKTSGAKTVHLVLGFGREQIIPALHDIDLQLAFQDEQLGTGHAVAQALTHVSNCDVVVITYGDVPLLKPETIQKLANLAADGSLAILTEFLSEPAGYGRIIRDNGFIKAIVEDKDASEQQKQITEINTGVLAAPTSLLQQWLPRLSANNAQGEYYLTDIVAMAEADGIPIQAAHPTNSIETRGVNSRLQLATLERDYQLNSAHQFLDAGVGIIDPARFDVRGDLQVSQDVSIDVNCIFEGRVVIEAGVSIGPNCLIKNSHIGRQCRIEANSIVEDSIMDEACTVGPFARLRPGTRLANRVKVGNFVETKKVSVGVGSKINHLSYVGDAIIGERVNVGAGAITCNYDGVNKHITEIGDGAFIGSNCALVAPVKISRRVTVGAGSVLTEDVQEDSLALARGRQRNIKNWVSPAKKLSV